MPSAACHGNPECASTNRGGIEVLKPEGNAVGGMETTLFRLWRRTRGRLCCLLASFLGMQEVSALVDIGPRAVIRCALLVHY